MKSLIKTIATMMILTMLGLMCSCSKTDITESSDTNSSVPATSSSETVNKNDEIVSFKMFSTTLGSEKSNDNEIMDLIAQKTGVSVQEIWVSGTMDTTNLIDDLINAEQLPDMIYTDREAEKFYESEMTVAWDSYLEKYPNLKELHTDEEWDKLRQPDGHIYWADFADSCYQEDTSVYHEGQAFWIQARVLEWANYPKIETLDEYFDLLESFAEANPELPDGTPVIPYSTWCNDSLGIPSIYLDGYPNDGCVIVNTDEGSDKPRVVDYNTTDTAKEYFRKLNEEYKNGIIDPEFADMDRNEFWSKIETGSVLGFFDEYKSHEGLSMDAAFTKKQKATDGSRYTLRELGCDYVPLGLVSVSGMEQQYHSKSVMKTDEGLMVLNNCKDPDMVFQFFSDILEQDIHDLRFWGIEGTDYSKDENGLYYRTDEMRSNWLDEDYMDHHVCEYEMLPHWKGMSRDGINRMMPGEQPLEFRSTIPESVSRCFDAYGVENYVDMLGSIECEPYPWYPLSTWSDSLEEGNPCGDIRDKISKCKDEWLPIVITSDDFESSWNEYISAYEECDPQAFLYVAQAAVEARMG